MEQLKTIGFLLYGGVLLGFGLIPFCWLSITIYPSFLGIENQPRERLLITDCGGYINVLIATFTLGLSFSSERIVQTYSNAAKKHLDSKYEGCKISKLTDLGGRIFEIFYVCESYKEVTK